MYIVSELSLAAGILHVCNVTPPSFQVLCAVRDAWYVWLGTSPPPTQLIHSCSYLHRNQPEAAKQESASEHSPQKVGEAEERIEEERGKEERGEGEEEREKEEETGKEEKVNEDGKGEES